MLSPSTPSRPPRPWASSPTSGRRRGCPTSGARCRRLWRCSRRAARRGGAPGRRRAGGRGRRARVPFLPFFDGYRTSHEVNKIDLLADEDLRALLPEDLIEAHRRRALTPDRPGRRGTGQNPGTFFQAREAINPFYLAAPEIVQR